MRIDVFGLVLLFGVSGSLAKFCAVKEICANETTELDKWECYGRRIFRPYDKSEEEDIFIEHQCPSFGWGNSMRSLCIAGALAGALDARLSFKRDFRQFWELPATYEYDHRYTRKEWDYEKLGRNVTSFKKWVKRMKKPGKIEKKYKKAILGPAICAADQNLVAEGECMTEVLPNFGKCMQYGNLNIPIFYLTFRKPAPLLVKTMREIRRRLSLPQLPKDAEPYPGSWGLYTPGYYILGLHVRMVPLGFEPLSVEYSQEGTLNYRSEQMRHFWRRATDAAKAARALAACRNEQLLIYFATDDAENLRAPATERLSPYGRVVFGLKESEVGHMSPHWSPREAASVDEQLHKVRAKQQSAGGRDACRSAGGGNGDGDSGGDGGGGGGTDGTCKHSDGSLYVHTSSTLRTAEAIDVHARMSLAEWWILANAQWLVATSSSYSDVASSWGLSPGGHMERADLAGRVITRIDWNSGSCAAVGAADPEQARRCPNKG